jgi:fucose permease
MPFLRSELHISYGVGALHFSALACGLVVAGISGHAVIDRLGVTRTVGLGALVISLGALSVLFGQNVFLTVGGAWLVGGGGSHMGQALIATLCERFGEHRARALTELNVSSSIFASLSPLMVAAIIGMGIYWKAVLVIPVLVLSAICLAIRGTNTASLKLAAREAGAPQSLPKVYWLYFAIIFLSTAGEWSIGFWCTEFLEKVVHVSRVSACGGLSVFLGAMLFGRAVGSRVLASVKSRWLLPVFTLVAALGFIVFWFSRSFPLNMIGLAILGVGESNVYPMALAAAIGSSGGQTAKATSRMSLSTGAAILSAPLALGMLADRQGLFISHGIIACVFVLAAILTVTAVANSRRAQPAVDHC